LIATYYPFSFATLKPLVAERVVAILTDVSGQVVDPIFKGRWVIAQKIALLLFFVAEA
jgi:hypothetical protein